MRRILTVGLGLTFVVAIGFGVFFVRLMMDMGSFLEVEAHFDGTCERFDGFAGGTEDVLIDRDTGWVFVSSDDRRAYAADPISPPRGAIEVFRLDNPQAGHINITPDVPHDFHPHGFSMYDDPTGKRLFVINHPTNGTQLIELFDVTYGADGVPSLEYVGSISDPLIVSPNDLVATGLVSFYVGNDYSQRDAGSLRHTLELFLRQNKTNLIYYDGNDARVVADGLTYANGVNVSPDGETLYLAETTDGVIRIYDRDIANGALTQREGPEGVLSFGTGVDNIDIDDQGRVWVAAHPKMFDVQSHMNDADFPSPSQVLLIDPNDQTIAEVYMDTGEFISAAATAAFHDGRMVLGVIFNDQVAVCDVADERVN